MLNLYECENLSRTDFKFNSVVDLLVVVPNRLVIPELTVGVAPKRDGIVVAAGAAGFVPVHGKIYFNI